MILCLKISQLNTPTLLMKNKINMCLFHLNISSLCFHTEELTTLISEHDLAFDITGISKCQLKLDKDPLILFKYQCTTLSSLPLNVIMEALHYT